MLLCYVASVHVNQALYIGETGRRLGDRFREHLSDVEKDNKNESKPVAKHVTLISSIILSNILAVCGFSLHQGSTESRKTLEQFFFSNRRS